MSLGVRSDLRDGFQPRYTACVGKLLSELFIKRLGTD